MDEQNPPAPAPAEETPPPDPKAARRRAIVGIAAAVVIGAAATGIAYYAEHHAGWVAKVDGQPVAKADYERLYGQSDHVRMYGEDVTARWAPTGVAIEEVPWDRCFTAGQHHRAALTGEDDRFWMLRAGG